MDNERASKSNALIATPVARDKVIEKLQDHYANNHIEVADFEARVELAERARSNEELVRVLHGLPALEGSEAEIITSPGRLTTTIKATLGSTTRRGRWRIPAHARVSALLGSIELDLTEAELARGETLLEVSAILGSVVITIPEGLAVECEGSAILGSFDHIEQTPASKRDPRVLRIVGAARLGSVEIIVKPKSRGLISGIKALLTGR